MKAGIAGLGWVTPLGADLDMVWNALRSGAAAESRPIQNPESGRVLECRPVPSKCIEHLGRNPRLRRSSAISYFAVAAAQAALANAGLATLGEAAARTSLVFAVSDGGVIYTRRFYDQIAKQGANAASPLLFPETVYNAPASHLAAALGIDGASYTLVGDNTVGLSALHFASQLLALGECDHVVVVGCEEIDWILCEAFHDWRLASTPLSEGAGAIILQRGATQIELQTNPGVPFKLRREAGGALEEALTQFCQADLVVSSACNRFSERAEANALQAGATIRRPKLQLGEAPGASAMWQVICAALALAKQEAASALIPVVGFNQHAAAARLSRS